MSHVVTLPSLELLLIAARAVALVLGLLMFAWAFRHWRRAATRDTQRVFEQLDLVRSELLIMKEVMHHSAHRTDSVPRTVTHDTRLPMAGANSSARGYETAARMARNGASKDELVRGCGITSHEAELLVKLHGQRRDGGAELIGRQPRLAESFAATRDSVTTRQSGQPEARPQAADQFNSDLLVGRNAARQTATTPRQSAAATTATQRTSERATTPSKNSGLPPRSRLVAVG